MQGQTDGEIGCGFNKQVYQGTDKLFADGLKHKCLFFKEGGAERTQTTAVGLTMYSVNTERVR